MYEMSSDKEWQAECDARTLAEAEVIKSDSERMNRAQGAAAKMAKEEEKEKDAMKKVAAGGMVYNMPEMG
jgi:hypothetical protein